MFFTLSFEMNEVDEGWLVEMLILDFFSPCEKILNGSIENGFITISLLYFRVLKLL